MSFALKKRIVVGTLIAMAVWPLVHRAVVPLLDISPWKFFGWAMYTVPMRSVRVMVVEPNTSRTPDIPRLADQPYSLRMALSKFTNLRQAMGHHVRPDDYAAILHESYPDIGGFQVVVAELELDRETALIEETRRTSFFYDASGRPEFD